MERVFNFSAGPSALPEPVMKKAQNEMTNYVGTGLSVMEMSHRSKEFIAIKEAAEKIRQDSLKSAMSIQDKPAETQTEAKTDEEPTALIAKRD